MQSIELERTFLARYLPEDLKKHPYKKLIDIYFPASIDHPTLRIRQKADSYEMVKKFQPDPKNASYHIEQQIILSKEEFIVLSEAPGKRLVKTRYDYMYHDVKLEIDIFEEKLSGLVLVDAEFDDPIKMNAFIMPAFCLIEVTQEQFLAGGMLCGKRYEDIEKDLAQLQYKSLSEKFTNKAL